MDEAIVRRCAEEHAEAVRTLNIERAAQDLVPELHAQIAAMAQVLPAPMSDAVVESLACADGYAESVTAYTGADVTVKVRARWEDRGAGRPQIVDAAPVAG
ncbi:MAG: hypothetical protein ACYDHH_15025 [Solirubrobacteraceae bacterium]